MVGGVLAFALALMLYLCWARGIWIDEIWSVWLSQHDLPLSEIFTERWLRDVHPPLFSAMGWLFEPLVGSDITARRMLNLIPFAGLGLGSLYLIRRNPSSAPVVLVFLCLLATNRYFLTYFAEHRPYGLLMCSYGLSLLALFSISESRADYDGRKDLPLALVMASATIVALNTQYVSAFVSATPIGFLLLDQLFRKHWRWSAWIAGAGVVAIAPLVGAFYLQLPYIAPTASNLWIKTDFARGVKTIVQVSVECGAANIVAAAAAGLAVLGALRAPKRLPAADSPPSIEWRFPIALAAGLAAAALGMVAINELKPIIEHRYFTPFAPAISLVVAILSARLLSSRRAVFVAFALNAGLVALVGGQREAQNLRWYDTARYIQAEVKACPTTRVYGVDPRYMTPYLGAEGHDQVQAWGYRLVGRAFGFAPETLDKDAPVPLRLDARCPTLIWGEHMPWIRATQIHGADFARTLPPGARLTSASLYKGQSGFVFRLPPAP